jgi:Ca-activated chloride channel family protein
MNRGDLTRLIEEKARAGVYLTILGYGMGNFKDATLEELSNRGNGNYAYIDSLNEARKVLVEQMAGTLLTIPRDVKIQVDFNPLRVAAYRLVGYENRLLRNEDFNDDAKDAGDIGSGHTVTALYEVVPAGKKIPCPASIRRAIRPWARQRPPLAARSCSPFGCATRNRMGRRASFWKCR